MNFYITALALRTDNYEGDSNSPSGSSEDIQSSGNSSLNLSEDEQEGIKENRGLEKI
jgi:hypothetical protein